MRLWMTTLTTPRHLVHGLQHRLKPGATLGALACPGEACFPVQSPGSTTPRREWGCPELWEGGGRECR